MRVMVAGRYPGTVRFLGTTHFMDGVWAGVGTSAHLGGWLVGLFD